MIRFLLNALLALAALRAPIGQLERDGRLIPRERHKIGVLVGAYVYDGLGRVISRTWPVSLSSACLEHQHFYYDGARRIQEQSFIETTNCSGTPSGSWTTRREYIQGADYIDEYVAEVTNPACDCAGTRTDTCGGGGSTSGHCGSPTNDRALAVYYLQDANFNVVATLDDGCPDHDCGSGTSWSPTGPVSVYEQYTYEPYGQPSSVDKFGSSQPQNPVGHQGLIFDRYCGDTPTDPCILTTQKGLYNNRNRFYHAKLGRFTTPDPSSTGIPTDRRAPSVIPGAQYDSGTSLYQYCNSTPVCMRDPSGLDWHHLYPQYLGGSSDGPGIWLSEEAHNIFHSRLSNLLGGSTPEAQRAVWKLLSNEERMNYLRLAAQSSGVDIESSAFESVLQEAYVLAKHGEKVEWGPIAKGFHRQVPMKSSGPRSLVTREIPGASTARAIAIGGAVVGGVLAASQVAYALDLGNGSLHELAKASIRGKHGGLSLWDEAFAYMDFYDLTGEPVSAAWAWRMWEQKVDGDGNY